MLTKPNPTVKDTQAKRPCGTAEGRYDAYAGDREMFLVRARRCSLLTIPTLFREVGSDGSTDTVVPWQNLGAYGTNVLSAKTVLSIFPSGLPFMEFKPAKVVLDDLKKQVTDEMKRGVIKAEIDTALAEVVREFVDCVEEDGDRYKLFDAIRHLVVGGNHGLKVDPEDDSLQSIPLERYVTRRDKKGKLIEAIVQDPLAWEDTPDDIKDILRERGYQEDSSIAVQKPIEVYTWMLLRAGRYRIKQEVWGETISGSETSYDPDALPWMFLRMVALEDENYGRGWIEDYEGDLQSIDGLWQIILETGAGGAMLKWLIKAGGTVNKETFARAQNGEAITGSEGEVFAVQANKGGDINAVMQAAEKLENRFERATLVNSSVQRKGERVTGIEIKYVAQELDATLGGVYSNLVVSLQMPYAKRKLAGLQRHGRVTDFPKNSVKVQVLTGERALGRREEAQDLDEMLQTASTLFPSNSAITPYVGIGTYLRRSAASRLIDPEGLVKTDDMVSAERQQEQQMAMASQVAPQVVQQAGQMIQNKQQAGLDAAAQPPPPEAVQAPAAAPAQ